MSATPTPAERSAAAAYRAQRASERMLQHDADRAAREDVRRLGKPDFADELAAYARRWYGDDGELADGWEGADI